MQLLQTWDRTNTFDPTNPNQQPLQYYSPMAMGYRSAFWNEQPTTAKNLMGLGMSPTTFSVVRIGIVAGLSVAAYFAYKKAKAQGVFHGPRLAPTNPEGMTWIEWKHAAQVPKTHAVKARKAWRDGEDPTEWRAWAQRWGLRGPSRARNGRFKRR